MSKSISSKQVVEAVKALGLDPSRISSLHLTADSISAKCPKGEGEYEFVDYEVTYEGQGS